MYSSILITLCQDSVHPYSHSRDCLFGYQFRNDEQRRLLMRCNMHGLLQQLDAQPPGRRLAFAIRRQSALASGSTPESVSKSASATVLSSAAEAPASASAPESVSAVETTPLAAHSSSENQLVSAAILLDAGASVLRTEACGRCTLLLYAGLVDGDHQCSALFEIAPKGAVIFLFFYAMFFVSHGPYVSLSRAHRPALGPIAGR